MAKKTTKAKSKKSAAKADVENYRHKEAKRKNIPTAENQKLVADEDKATKKLRWPRNPDLDPQLVWRGKDWEADPLEVDAPPIYIQEKIQPRAIIEDLRKQSKERAKEGAPQFDFFGDFNGLPEGWKEDATQSYYHDEGNWQNRMILGDSLLVMASLAEREGLRGKVQCIYFDPPYGITFNSNWQPTVKSREMRDGAVESTSREPEVIRAFRDTWKDEIHSYLAYLRDRITAAHDLLSESGSIFVQIGDENVHRVRALLDEVFGEKNVVVLIPLKKKGAQKSNLLDPVNDYIVWATKDKSRAKFHQLYEDRIDEAELARDFRLVTDGNGYFSSISAVANLDDVGSLYEFKPLEIEKRHPDWKLFTSENITAGGYRTNQSHVFRYQDRDFDPGLTRNSCWKHTAISTDGHLSGMERLARSGRLYVGKNQIRYVRYASDFGIQPVSNWWDGLGGAKDPIYVVQTNTEVVKRCVLMTSDPGDLILDPTCGSGTTAFVAEQWGRRWITIDTSRVALTLARARLMGAKYEYYLLKDSPEGAIQEGEITGKAPTAGSFTNSIRHGFVCERLPHITSAVIANDVEIDVIWDRWQNTLEPLREQLNRVLREKWKEWQIPREVDDKWSVSTKQLHAQWWEARRARQKEIDESIARNADVEYLYDRPYKARGVVRVAGPFTVESLSPHRVLPMGEDPYIEELLSAENEGEVPPSLTLPRKGGGDTAATSGEVTTDFAQVVYENLKASGVQNTKKGERLILENLRPFASKSGLIAFQGEYKEKGQAKRAAVCIGPEYDTVGYELVRRAAREALDAFDMLIVCGFAFAPEVDDTRLSFGELVVLKARMNQDLRMADKLKATGAGNLFVVFGEPDIKTKDLGNGMIQVEILGMDIFDPTTGEVRSSTGKNLMNDVAAWFIDIDYDEESFFVRQAYFVGDDPYDGLKRALKAEIDETAWADLNSTVSRPFPKPERGRICVKVINHFGDEVQKVFSV
jgi:adenine-specific DNA-methyltransferase